LDRGTQQSISAVCFWTAAASSSSVDFARLTPAAKPADSAVIWILPSRQTSPIPVKIFEGQTEKNLIQF
jgi:hypothetical protein